MDQLDTQHEAENYDEVCGTTLNSLRSPSPGGMHHARKTRQDKTRQDKTRQDKTRQITRPPGHTKERTRLLEALFLLDSGLISGVFTPAQGLFLSGTVHTPQISSTVCYARREPTERQKR